MCGQFSFLARKWESLFNSSLLLQLYTPTTHLDTDNPTVKDGSLITNKLWTSHHILYCLITGNDYYYDSCVYFMLI